MHEIYVLPNASVAYWTPASMNRAQELAVQAVETGEVRQLSHGYLRAVSNHRP